MKMATGSTPVGQTDWQQYKTNGIYVDIDTSSAGFTQTPHYLTSLGGRGSHWTTMGATSIYRPSPTGFRVYIFKDGLNLTPGFANQKNWHINWAGFGQ